jgi:AraC family transcriptional regulator, activator of mtrCDE
MKSSWTTLKSRLRMPHRPLARISHSDLDRLIGRLEVTFIKLAECLVSPGWRLSMAGGSMPVIHYVLAGAGRVIMRDQPEIILQPHTLFVVPSEQSFMIEAAVKRRSRAAWKTVESGLQKFAPGAPRRFVVGRGKPQLQIIGGSFLAYYGISIDLFAALRTPIAEQFDPVAGVGDKLKMVMAELLTHEIGAAAMSAALLKEILVTLLRRSLSSHQLWVERFSILSNQRIACAFAMMVTHPGAPHSIHTLSRVSGLSRSVFMSRFAAAFGHSPMAVLRQLRMRHAAVLLTDNSLSIDKVADAAGYASRSSFIRAFRIAYGRDPSRYRAVAQGKIAAPVQAL